MTDLENNDRKYIVYIWQTIKILAVLYLLSAVHQTYFENKQGGKRYTRFADSGLYALVNIKVLTRGKKATVFSLS